MDDQHPHGSNAPAITRQCTATSKRSGNQCRKPAMRGRTVCLAHGGRTPRGVASPHFKTGRHSRSLPGHLVADYERALNDPKLLSLRDEIALNEAMLVTVLHQLGDDPNQPARDRRLFRQIMRHIDLKRRLVETEVRHIVLAREMLTAEEAFALMRAVLGVVTHYLPDPADRAAITEEITALISMNGPETPIGAHHYD